ncbi:hypothetical protein [Sphingomonas sp. NPDC079357]|uniref:hypothetical protein n=1 Tax=Sphingomonas sp. NPDC079357 TaxID=3364518 RepID=UPI0038515A0C
MPSLDVQDSPSAGITWVCAKATVAINGTSTGAAPDGVSDLAVVAATTLTSVDSLAPADGAELSEDNDKETPPIATIGTANASAAFTLAYPPSLRSIVISAPALSFEQALILTICWLREDHRLQIFAI